MEVISFVWIPSVSKWDIGTNVTVIVRESNPLVQSISYKADRVTIADTQTNDWYLAMQLASLGRGLDHCVVEAILLPY